MLASIPEGQSMACTLVSHKLQEMSQQMSQQATLKKGAVHMGKHSGKVLGVSHTE